MYDPNLCADTVVRTLQLLSRFTGNERKRAPARPRKPKASPCRRCTHTEGKSSGAAASLLDPQVTEFLLARGLGRYAAVFADNEVTMDVLRHLTLDDLAEMPIKQVGARRALLLACAGQQSSAEPQAAASTGTQEQPTAGALRAWLHEHGLARFGTLLELHGVTAALLPRLTDADVAEMVPMSLSMMAAAPLLMALKALRTQTNAAVVTATGSGSGVVS